MNRMIFRSAELLVCAWTAFAAASLPATAQVPPVPRDTADSAPKPLLFVEQRDLDLGTVLEGDVKTITWSLENRGGADLVIDRTGASCGCTVVRLTEEEKVIRPGGKLELKAEFNSTGRFGEQNKTVNVYSNDPLAPEMKLSFRAKVDMLYLADPNGMVNLGVVRRGETSQRVLDLKPVGDRGELVIRGLELEAGSPVAAAYEAIGGQGSAGQRIKFSIVESAALGPVGTSAVIRLSVGDIERERTVPIRGEIVGDLTWLPKVIDATRQPSLPGKKLAPVTIGSPDRRPFQIREVDAGPLLSAAAEPSRSGKPGTEYSVSLTVRPDAAPGPFGATLRVMTDSLDQPVVEIPVFGIVSPRVEVEPPMILLRADGTPEGMKRRLRLQTADATALRVTGQESDHPSVKVTYDARSSARYTHLRYFDVELTGEPAVGAHEAMIRVRTDVTGDRPIEIPVRIEVPAKR